MLCFKLLNSRLTPPVKVQSYLKSLIFNLKCTQSNTTVPPFSTENQNRKYFMKLLLGFEIMSRQIVTFADVFASFERPEQE